MGGGRDIQRAWVMDSNAAPARQPSVVHSSPGRLRVHLPHWTGGDDADLALALRRLPGVVDAEANSITQNALIRFDPRQTNARALLEILPDVRMEPRLDLSLVKLEAPSVAAVNLPEAAALPEFTYVTGTRRIVYQGLGWASVGMAVVGFILPGIPGAPFVILAGYFFIRSSPESHQWLRQSRWFGPLLRDWEEHRAIRRSLRNMALALIGAAMVLILLLGLPTVLTALIIACQMIGVAIVSRLPVIEPAPAIAVAPVA